MAYDFGFFEQVAQGDVGAVFAITRKDRDKVTLTRQDGAETPPLPPPPVLISPPPNPLNEADWPAIKRARAIGKSPT